MSWKRRDHPLFTQKTSLQHDHHPHGTKSIAFPCRPFEDLPKDLSDSEPTSSYPDRINRTRTESTPSPK